jgi:hypothetical protein
LAVDPSGSVSPSSVAPGGTVSLALRGCNTQTGSVTSTAFGTVSLRQGNAQTTHLFGTAIVSQNARAGTHPVTFTCGTSGPTATVRLTVVPGPARGGIGGSFGRLTTAEVAIGGALVASALGGGYWVLRRRAEPRA